MKRLTTIASRVHILLFALLFSATWTLHAEGGCPSGMIPANGSNINSCVPIPAGYYESRQQANQLSPPQWVSMWGAIATDFPHSSAGASINQRNSVSAEEAAIANCKSNGGRTCTIETLYRDGCAVMIVGDNSHVSLNAATIERATQLGLDMCVRDGDTNCHVYYSACSLPQQAP